MKARCSKCGNVFEAEADAQGIIECPGCGAKMRTRPASAPPMPPPMAPPMPPPLPSGGPTPSDSVPALSLPEIMRANKVIAGRSCPSCGGTIALAQEVHNCQKCGSSFHASCWDAGGGCASCAPRSGKAASGVVARAGAPDDYGRADDGGDTKPCKFCGEQIKVTARKCRFCNEFQSAVDRAHYHGAGGGGGGGGGSPGSQAYPSPDDDMTAGDWVVAIICSTIGCIAGIIWCIQGKKKGPKMVLVSVIANVIASVIWGFLQAANRSNW